MAINFNDSANRIVNQFNENLQRSLSTRLEIYKNDM